SLMLHVHIAATFWGSIAEDYAAVSPPSGFQGLISWLFLPSVALGMYLDVPVRFKLNSSLIQCW
nr:photosynthetic NDH subunit of subcomplex B 5, chloroplastic [Tanacetum cinerariifolium]